MSNFYVNSIKRKMKFQKLDLQNLQNQEFEASSGGRNVSAEDELKIEEKFKIITHDYPDFRVKLHSYICRTNKFSGKLYEHSDFKLLKIKDLKYLDWLEADIPLIDSLTLKYNE